VPIGRDTALPPAIAPGAGRKTFRMFLVAALLVGGGVAFGLWRHSLAEAEVNATSEQRRSIVPAVRVTTVRADDGMTVALLPASTDAFEVANIMARISGYVAKRYVDIGDHVKAEQLLAEISAPENLITKSPRPKRRSPSARRRSTRRKRSGRSRASPGTATARGWCRRRLHLGGSCRIFLSEAVPHCNMNREQAPRMPRARDDPYARRWPYSCDLNDSRFPGTLRTCRRFLNRRLP
jgi:hypothetical protein